MIYDIWKFFFSGCTQTCSTNYCEKETQDTLMESIESKLVDVRQEKFVGPAFTDWFVYGREFYVKTGEDTYEKRDLPQAVQHILQERKITYFCLEKEDNKLVMESEADFFIYDFTTNRMEEYSTEYGHLDWQI